MRPNLIDDSTGRHLISGAYVGRAPGTQTRPEGLEGATVSGDGSTEARPWSPSSPAFFAIALAAAALGLYGISTSVHVGPVRGSASVGK